MGRWALLDAYDRCNLHAVLPRPLAPQADDDMQDAWKKGT